MVTSTRAASDNMTRPRCHVRPLRSRLTNVKLIFQWRLCEQHTKVHSLSKALLFLWNLHRKSFLSGLIVNQHPEKRYSCLTRVVLRLRDSMGTRGMIKVVTATRKAFRTLATPVNRDDEDTEQRMMSNIWYMKSSNGINSLLQQYSNRSTSDLTILHHRQRLCIKRNFSSQLLA